MWLVGPTQVGLLLASFDKFSCFSNVSWFVCPSRPLARRSSLISIRVITPASILILNPSEDGGRGTAKAQTHLKYAIMSLAEERNYV